MRINRLVVLAFVAVLLSASVSLADDSNNSAKSDTHHSKVVKDKTPLILLKRTERKVRRILAIKTKKGTKRHKAKKIALKRVINRLFDFNELAKRSLGKHWDKRTEKERKEFVSLLKALIEKNYLLRITERTTYKAKFVSYQCDGKTARVGVKVKSGKYELEFTFVLYKTSKGKWAIFDMIIDDVSLIENYSSQFNKIIKKKGFAKLLEKMRKKLEED